MSSPEAIARDRLELIGRLLPGLAHDLGNPLNSIAILAQTAARRSGDPELRARLDKISSHAWRIQGLVSEVLALADPCAADTEVLDLGGLLEDALRLQRFHKPTRGVRFRRHLPEPAPRVRGTRGPLVQALVLYLIAAAEVRAPGTGVEREVRIRGSRSEGRVGCVTLHIDPMPPGPGERLELAEAIVRDLGGTLEEQGTGLALTLPEVIEEGR